VSATIPVTGVAGSATPVTVTATLGTTSAQAQVVVVATGRVPAPVAASPASATILVGQTLTVRVTLDVPARTGGTTVTVAPTGAGAVTAAATLAFPAGALTADLPVTGATAGPVTLTFSTTAGSTTAAITVSDRVGTMLISEYLEGSSYNKAIEVYNGSAATVSLATCALKQYTNGSTSGTTIALGSADLAPGEVFVICATRISDSTFCDMTTGSLTFNGNDAVELVCGGAAADVFGQIGFDPGTAWGTGGVSTKDHTLRRSCEVFAGDADGSDAFDPSVEWTGFAIDSFDGLGVHCP